MRGGPDADIYCEARWLEERLPRPVDDLEAWDEEPPEGWDDLGKPEDSDEPED